MVVDRDDLNADGAVCRETFANAYKQTAAHCCAAAGYRV